METVSYGNFSRELHSITTAQRVPTDAQIEVTRRCPLECAHCYNNLPMDDAEARNGELTYEELCRVLDEIAESGCLWVCFTGGEIFARRDFLDIYTYAKKKGFIITLFTNGTLITEKIADYLAEWRPFSIEITLYGYTKETYERLTGIPGSHEKCYRAVDLLLERKLPLKLKTVAVSINKHEVHDMQRYAESRGVAFKFDAMMNPRIDCSQSPLAVRLKPEEVVEFDLLEDRRIAEYESLIASSIQLMPTRAAKDEVYHCGGGVKGFAVDPEGKMSICVLSQVDTYDLRKGGFQEGWNDFLFEVRSRKKTRPTKCHECGLLNTCGMCPANGELEHQDKEAPVDFLCQTAHLRAYTLGFEVPAHGECAFCDGGSGYEETMRSVEYLRSRLLGEQRATTRAVRYLPIINTQSQATSGCSSGGCSSCAAD